MTSPQVVEVRRRGPRRETVYTAVGLLVLLLVVGIALLALRTAEDANQQLQSDKTAETTAIGQLSSALQTTQTQLKDHGLQPSAPPPGQIVQGVPGMQGIQGVPGPIGPTGPAGPVGPTGPAGATGKTGATGVAGQPGTPGQTGSQGTAGQPGQTGATGPEGPAGPAGPAGSPGSPGQPPAGWTYTDAQGNTYSCTRVANFDPSSPQYQCALTGSAPAPSQTPAPSQGQQAITTGSQTKQAKRTAVQVTEPK